MAVQTILLRCDSEAEIHVSLAAEEMRCFVVHQRHSPCVWL